MNKELWIQPLLFTFSCTTFYLLTSKLLSNLDKVSMYENKLEVYQEKLNSLEVRIDDLEEFRHKMCESTLALSQQRDWDGNASSDDELLSD
jgi:vacuolar-type H+-ATPase subunit I/STV1